MSLLPRPSSPLLDAFDRALRLPHVRSCYDLREALESDGWELDSLSPEQAARAHKVSARHAVAALKRLYAAAPPACSPGTRPFALPCTGAFLHVPRALGQEVLPGLRERCDRYFKSPGLSPLRIFGAERGTAKRSDVLRELGIDRLVGRLAEQLQEEEGSRLTLLGNRSFVRRAHPPDERRPEHRNRNNQHWHQDSNPLFGGRPMLTLWIPLQDGAGVERPGLAIADCILEDFDMSLSEGGSVEEALMARFGSVNVTVPAVAAGDAVIITGLTVHRTWSTPAMTRHRDALLLRFVRSDDAGLFVGDRRDDVEFIL